MNKVIFGTTTDKENNPVIIFGIPQEAWDYMKDGKTHTFDLTQAGLPIKIMLYGAPDHDTALKFIQDAIKAGGHDVIDMRHKDFAINDNPGNGGSEHKQQSITMEKDKTNAPEEQSSGGENQKNRPEGPNTGGDKSTGGEGANRNADAGSDEERESKDNPNRKSGS